MRRNNPLVLLLVALTICATLTLQIGLGQAQATEANLADKAVNYVYNQYLVNGAQFDSTVNGAYVAYILTSAGVDVSGWVYNGKNMPDAVVDLINQDLQGTGSSAKRLAEDLIAMQALGKDTAQLQSLLLSRESITGLDQGLYSIYSNAPAYDLLGRAGKLGGNNSVFNVIYARTYILGQQGTDGSWGYADFQSTTEAIRTLAYLDPAKSDSTVQQAISNGCSWLQQQQQSDGSFAVSSWDDPLTDTTEAIATQTVLGIGPASWKNASGKSAVDYLNDKALNSDGSFGTSGNVMDAAWALDALHQLGQNPQGVYFVVTPNSKTLSVGDTLQLNASQLNASLQGTDVTQDTDWSVADSSIASINDHGLVTANKQGATVVTAVYDGFSVPVSLTIQSNSSGSSGITVYVTVIGDNNQYLFGPDQAVTLSSSNPTALEALAATGLSYQTSTTYSGFVTSINNLANVGQQGWMYSVNGQQPGGIAGNVSVHDGDKERWWYGTATDLSSGSATTSSSGSATVDPATGGTVGLGSEASVSIPAGALNGTTAVDVAVQKVSAPPSAPTGFQTLGSVFEFTVGGNSGYKFAKPVTLTFSFDPAALSPGETPAVYYYDTTASQWVGLGGTVSGSTITVNVDHFTKFAVLAGKVETPVAPAVALPTAPAFSDVSVSYWAYNAIGSLCGLGYVAGYPDGTFKPDNQITRAEFISILNKVLQPPAYNPATPDFSDVAPGDWCYGSVESAVYAGVVKGDGRAFSPNAQITREELAVILANALGKQDEARLNSNNMTDFTDDTGISSWARGCVTVAVKDGLIKGYPDDNSFRPQNGATRAEACTVINNFLNVHK